MTGWEEGSVAGAKKYHKNKKYKLIDGKDLIKANQKARAKLE